MITTRLRERLTLIRKNKHQNEFHAGIQRLEETRSAAEFFGEKTPLQCCVIPESVLEARCGFRSGATRTLPSVSEVRGAFQSASGTSGIQLPIISLLPEEPTARHQNRKEPNQHGYHDHAQSSGK